ncbi:uncharacterized protein LOC112343712 [Selaginella moellendorffii]|uniref:uncharacterized protein LOC112343712 n=1 Tax=Selaginella moellendorffii TaxID=88036 RepID=UPI000D1CA17A|nr:uncharacterized protein LOC112343712 [Selaginella moellendorffii]|eukprot:XP_024523447.1 uncharacterized protein LOC112343712 [Selaginella moellendorffii]
MVELGNSSWKHSGRVNWENEDLHTITGLSVIHMLLAENQGGQNWSKPRVREIACPSNRWPGFLFSRMPGTLCMSSSASSSPPDLRYASWNIAHLKGRIAFQGICFRLEDEWLNVSIGI